MHTRLENLTCFDDFLLRRLLSKTLTAVGFKRHQVHTLVFRVVYRRPASAKVGHVGNVGVRGRAMIGYCHYNRTTPGTWLRLQIPRPEHWTADTWRKVVAVTIHECMHLVGSRHKDMTPAQRRCTLPLPKWALTLTPIFPCQPASD